MFLNAVSPIVWNDTVTIVAGPNVRPGLRSFKVLPDGSFEEPWTDIRLLNSQYTNPIVIGGYLFGFTPMKQGGPDIKCIDLNNGKLCWSDKPGLGRCNLLAVEDSLLMLGEGGELGVVQINTTKMVLKSTSRPLLKKPCYTPMALNQGRLLIRNERTLKCLDLRSLKQ